MGKASKRAAPKQASGPAKKSKFKPQPVPEPESSSENEATFYQSAEDDELKTKDESSGMSDLSDSEASAESEDELDELDDLDDEKAEEASDAGSESDDGENGADTKAADPNKKSSAEQHAEQRKLLAERKLQRKAGAEVERIKSLWEKLRVNKPPPPKAVREKLCNEIWELSKDVIHDLVLKHDASRVVQTLVKYTTKERRDLVVRALKGNYYQLATSSYGKYLLVKLLHYGLKESRALIVDELHGKLRKLMRHKEGAYVVEDLFVLYSTAAQKQQMVREFWGAEYAVFKELGRDKSVVDAVNELSEKRQLIMTNLYGTIAASVNKGLTGFQILHAAMKDYVSILVADVDKHDAQIREFVDLLAEQVAELVHTQQGAEVAATVIALANAKERKAIVRALKSHARELVKNEYGNSVLITLFMVVDDTVLVHKAFSSELLVPEFVPEMLADKYLRRPFLYLLRGLVGKYFAPKSRDEFVRLETLAYAKTLKKPQEQRRLELQSRAVPLVYQALLAAAQPGAEPSLATVMAENTAVQAVTELLLTPSDDDEINSLRADLVQAIHDLLFATDILEEFHVVNKIPFFSRSLKALVQGTEFKWDPETKKLVAVEEGKVPSVGSAFAEKLADSLLEKDTLKKWVSGQGAFVVLSVYEVLALSDAKRAGAIKKQLKLLKKSLAADKDNKGAQLLLKAL